MLNQFLTNVFMLKNNFYNLYFNIKGKGSSSLIISLEDNIKSINEIYIKLAELIKKIGGYPIMNLSEIKNISTIKEIVSKDYDVDEASDIMLSNLTLINNMNKQVGEYAFKNNDLDSINFVLNFNNYLSNNIRLLKMNKIDYSFSLASKLSHTVASLCSQSHASQSQLTLISSRLHSQFLVLLYLQLDTLHLIF